MLERSKLLQYFELNSDYMEDKIKRGIEENRKGYFSLKFIDKNGIPIVNSNLSVKIKQLAHDFKFGCNLFMLDQFDSYEKNEAYKKAFNKLFNFTIVPFFWDSLEPQHGKYRFDSNSEKIYRRPPIETVMDFCNKNNIYTKGHPLLWHNLNPAWLPNDTEEIKPYIIERFEKIAEKYADRIKIWDVVNESLVSYDFKKFRLFDHYVDWAFKQANNLFTKNKLFINETPWGAWTWFSGTQSAYFMQIEGLLLRNIRLDGIGMQFHMFYTPEEIYGHAKNLYNPKRLYDIMDCYGKFNLPIHISEVTIPSYTSEKCDEEIQAQLVRNLYSIWFSHKNVEAIMWWNLIDGYAYVQEDLDWDENYYAGGLIKKNFTVKPSYNVLDELINKEWQTNVTIENIQNDTVNVNAFYGKYNIEVYYNGKLIKKDIIFRKSGANQFNIKLN